MSEDLIERLMMSETWGRHYDNLATRLEAKAEIERLRAKLVEVGRLTDGLNDEVQFMRNVAKENRNRTEAAEKRLASAKEVIAPFSDRLQQLPWALLQRGLSAPVSIADLRAAAEWMEKGDE